MNCARSVDGYARHAHVELCHKDQVQNDVQEGGDDQVLQGAHGVAQAPEDAGEDVVEPAARDAQEDDLHIADAHVVGLLRGAQHSEHGGGHRCPKDHHEEGGDEGEHHAGAHGVAELLLLLRAEVLGHHDARPGGDAHEEDNQQVQRGPAPAHGGQGVVPHVLADDDGVGGVVELLGNVADEQGHGKGHDLLPGFAHGHVLGFKQFGKF